MAQVKVFALGLALVGASTFTLADNEVEGNGRRIALHPKVAQECSACHVAFWPNFLPTSSWKQVLTTLDKHYGADASLPAADQQEITDWIIANPQRSEEHTSGVARRSKARPIAKPATSMRPRAISTNTRFASQVNFSFHSH